MLVNRYSGVRVTRLGCEESLGVRTERPDFRILAEPLGFRASLGETP
jgi:hypothetical protein